MSLQHMTEYRLLAWPELPADFDRTLYRRMASELSHRFVSASALMQSCGASKLEVRMFLQTLEDGGLLESRQTDEPPSFFDRLGRASDWVKDTFFSDFNTK